MQIISGFQRPKNSLVLRRFLVPGKPELPELPDGLWEGGAGEDDADSSED